MSAQRLALNQILRNSPRIVTTPHPSTTLLDSDDELKNCQPGPLFEAAVPNAQCIRNVPLSIGFSPLLPIHLLGINKEDQPENESNTTFSSTISSKSSSIEEKLPLPTVKPSSLCEAGVQTEIAITEYVPKHESVEWTKKWELANSLGEIDFDNQEYSKAVVHFKKAAKNGCVLAMTNLAHCYAEGLGCKKSNTRAFLWWENAMKGGDVEAQYQLALCHIRGEGTAKSKDTGQQLMSKAANSGHSEASLYMALLLLRHEHLQESPTFAADVTRFVRQALRDEECEEKLRDLSKCSDVPIAARLVLHEALRHD